MIGANLILVVVLGQVPSSDAPALVAKLGAGRYADREGASQALERLGQRALPALRAAATARDPEVRTRAIALMAKIEGSLLTKPTLVALDFEDRTIAEVARALSDRAGIKLALFPENLPTWQSKITLRESAPVTFWQAIDRFCEAANLQYNEGATNGREPILPLFYGGGRPAGPISDHGPFRVRLVNLHYQRDVTFQPAPRTVVAPAFPAARRAVEPAGAPGVLTEQFFAQVQIVAEPRLSLQKTGDLKVLEAVDDRGQSLIAPGETTQRHSGYNSAVIPGSALPVQASLLRPKEPGSAIRKLRGVVPVTVRMRKPNPLVAPLANSAGKSFHNDDVTLTIVDVRLNPQSNQTSIELAVRVGDSQAQHEQGAGAGAAFDDFAPHRPDRFQQQIEVVDAQGRAIPWYHSGFTDESRMTITLMPNDPGSAPTQLRYYGLSRASAEVSFEFNDVRMP